MSRRAAQWLLLGIVLLGVGVRSWHVTARSLWFDEAFSWRLIQFPFAEMIARAQADVHPALYYILLKGWAVVFGSSLVSLRGFSIAGGAATIALAYLFAATAWRSRAAGLLAAVLVAVSGFQIQYAWEARMYMLGTALSLLCAWLLLRALRSRRQAWGWWLAFAAAAGALAHVHYYTLLTIASLGIFVLGYLLVHTRGRVGEILQWRVAWYAVFSFGIMGLLFAPWLPTFLQQNANVQEAFWIPPIGGWSIPDTFYRMLVPIVGIPRHDGFFFVTLALLPLLGVGLLWAGLLVANSRRQNADGAWLTVMLGSMPFGLSIVASFLGRSVYQDRYFVFAQVFILVAVAGAAAHLRWPWLRRTVVVVGILGLSWAYVDYWQELDLRHKPGAHAAAQTVYTQRQAEEPVLVSSPFVFFAIDHYAQEEFAATVRPQLYSPTGELLHFAGGPILTADDIAGDPFFAQPITSFWMVDTTGFGGQPLTPPSPWRAVGETQRFLEVFGYQGEVLVTRYRRD